MISLLSYITIMANAQTDMCLYDMFSSACGSNFLGNLVCLCNATNYQLIQTNLSYYCTTEDFAAAEQLEPQYCSNSCTQCIL